MSNAERRRRVSCTGPASFNGDPGISQPLQDDGLIGGYSVNSFTGETTINWGDILRGGGQLGGPAIGICIGTPGCIETATGVVLVGGALIIYGPQIVAAIRNWFETHKAPTSGPPSPTGSWPGWDATAPKGDGWNPNDQGGFSRPGADGGTESISPDLSGRGGTPHWDWSTQGGSNGNKTGRIYDDPNSNNGIFVPNY